MPDTLSTPAFLMLHDADRHYPECRHGRPGAYPADQPCTCGLGDEIAAIEAAHVDTLTAAVRNLPMIRFTDEQDESAGDVVYRAAVLAILRGEQHALGYREGYRKAEERIDTLTEAVEAVIAAGTFDYTFTPEQRAEIARLCTILRGEQ